MFKWFDRGRSKKRGSSTAADISVAPKGVPFNNAGEGDEILRVLDGEQTADLRQRFLQGPVHRAVEKVFGNDPTLHSMTLLVGQYWCDEASDAVQVTTVYSELETPVIEGFASDDRDEDGGDSVNLGGRRQWNLVDFTESPERHWAPNGYCIPLFAAFCIEGGHQEGDYLEFESPIAIYRRTGPKSASMEFVGTMVRPWLDGVSFEHAGPAGAQTFDLDAVEKWADKGIRR